MVSDKNATKHRENLQCQTQMIRNPIGRSCNHSQTLSRGLPHLEMKIKINTLKYLELKEHVLGETCSINIHIRLW